MHISPGTIQENRHPGLDSVVHTVSSGITEMP